MFRSSLWLVMGWKIKQQALESLLVGVLIFPSAKVYNMPGTTDIDGPGQIRLLHQLIQRDGEQHQFVLLLFILKSSHNFFLNPFAVDRMFREDYQELIVQTSRLINTMPKILPDLQVLRSKATTHAVALQVSIQPFSKVLVLASIANKAGVVLDRMGHQRTHVDDEVLWNTSSAQKDLGIVACEVVDGDNSSCECVTIEDGIAQFGMAKVCIIEVGNTEICTGELSIPEVGTTKVSISKVDKDEPGTAKIGIAELRTHEVGAAEICTYEVGMPEVSAVQDSLIEVSTHEVSITQDCLA